MRSGLPVRSFIALAAIVLAGTLPAACGDDEAVPAIEPASVEPLDTALLDDSYSGPPDEPDEADVEVQPERVYYVLTKFDWYARGEPIVLDGVAYTVAGDPVRLDALALAPVTEYRGVDVYRQNGDVLLYVPVFEGYWLGFAADPSAPLPPAPGTAAVADTAGTPN